MDDYIDIHTSEIPLEPQEIAVGIDALFEWICQRLLWAATPAHPYRADFELEFHQINMDMAVQTYTKLVMAMRETPIGMHERFEKRITFTDIIWDEIYRTAAAETWSDLPGHDHSKECRVCDKIMAGMYV